MEPIEIHWVVAPDTTWFRRRVNSVPTTPAFTPTVAVTQDGDVGVTYYDLRSLTPGTTSTPPLDTWLTVSPRGGQHFVRERRLAPTFDLLQAPNARGYFLGDYEGLTTFDDVPEVKHLLRNAR